MPIRRTKLPRKGITDKEREVYRQRAELLKESAGLGVVGKKQGRPTTAPLSKAYLQQEEAKGGITPEDGTDTQKRRELVYRYHLKGIHKDELAQFFGVSVQTIYKDIRKYNAQLQEELTDQGAAGVITESFAFYEGIRGEVLSMVSEIDTFSDKTPPKTYADKAKMLKDKMDLYRLAKELEDSKMRMMIAIGLVPRKVVKSIPGLPMEAGLEEINPYLTEDAAKALYEVLQEVDLLVSHQ